MGDIQQVGYTHKMGDICQMGDIQMGDFHQMGAIR